MNILLTIIVAVVCLLIGYFIGKILTKFDGLFIVKDDDLEKTQWILDVTIDPSKIPNKKEVRLKVKKMTEGDV